MRKQGEPQLRQWLTEECGRINGSVEEILFLHRLTPSPKQEHHLPAEPFGVARPTPPEAFRPRLLDRLIPGRRRRLEEEAAQQAARFQEDLAKWRELERQHQEDWARRRHRFEEERLTSIEVMTELLDEALHAVNWPRETKVSYEILPPGRLLHGDVDLPELEDMPVHSAEIAARGLKLNLRDRTPTEVRRLYFTHIHAVVFRVIGVAFATLPALAEVVVSGYSQRTDAATGVRRDDYLISVRVRRADWEPIDFERLDQLDPVAALARFNPRLEGAADSVLRTVIPIEVSG